MGQTIMDEFLDPYRQAGELYGRLIEALGFGRLTMSEDRDRGHAVMIFAWTFNTKKGGYRCEHRVEIMELAMFQPSFEAYAERLSNKWKSEHRRVTT